MTRRIEAILLSLSLVLLSACAGTITKTVPAAASETRPVVLLDHGRHASLVLTRADQNLVRYLYGDWRWYAENDTGPLRAIPTLFARTPSALGRREMSGPASSEALRRQVPVHIDQIHWLSADAARIDALDRRLSTYFEGRLDERLFNPVYELEFVPGPRPYTLFDNSNHIIAEWLEELGIEVRGNPIFGRWRVEAH